MFNHDRSEHSYMPFNEAVKKSGSVTLSRLDSHEDTGEGYSIYTFTVVESLYNPDGDTIIHLYEGTGPAGSETAYADGQTYLLCLSRATDVYYPHPYFHNFNGIRISADSSGQLLEAVNADGRDNTPEGARDQKGIQDTGWSDRICEKPAGFSPRITARTV